MEEFLSFFEIKYNRWMDIEKNIHTNTHKKAEIQQQQQFKYHNTLLLGKNNIEGL